MTARAKKVIKKVASKLTKASQAHAGQAKALKAIELRKGGSPKKKKSIMLSKLWRNITMDQNTIIKELNV